MGKVSSLLKIIFGVIIKLLTRVLDTKENLWVIGSGKGHLFNENSMYFYLEVLKSYPEIKIVWITKNRSLVTKLKSRGLPVLYNYSIIGVWTIMKSRWYLFSTVRNDIDFYFPGRQKNIVNLFHGMPIKKIIYDYDGKDLKPTFLITKLINKFVAGFMWEDVTFHICTSSFFAEYLMSAYRATRDQILICGLPRNDVLISGKGKEAFLEKYQLTNKYIISYLPTHRKFGNSESSPILFINNAVAQRYFEANNIVFIYKAHYNESPNFDLKSNIPLRDFSQESIDTQILLSASDILISDYSSCIVDYLLMDKPYIGYFYDDYQTEDTGLYFDIETEAFSPGLRTFNEAELLESIKEIFTTGDPYSEQRQKWKSKYHHFKDGNSAVRLIDHLIGN